VPIRPQAAAGGGGALPRGSVQRLFPFHAFFSDAPEGSLWAGSTEVTTVATCVKID